MKASVTAIVVLAAVGLVASDAAFAKGKGRSGGGSGQHSGSRHHHHRHHHASAHVFLGAFATAGMWPSWAYQTYAEYGGPVHYIERGQAAEGEWLYCSGRQAYFPHVMECPGGWQSVTPPAPPG